MVNLPGRPKLRPGLCHRIGLPGVHLPGGPRRSRFPVTSGVFQPSFQGSPSTLPYGAQDGFVAKLERDGSGLVWASYFGTDDGSIIRDIAIGPSGEIYLASGYTSGSFPPSVGNKFINTPKGRQYGQSRNASIFTQSLSPGVYFIQIRTENNETACLTWLRL